jgi:hypothetical protein
MKAGEIIKRYVYAVTRRLPASRRGDIGLELTALLHDEVSARVEAGESETDASTSTITRMGPPDVVARNYHDAVPVIDVRDTRIFAKAVVIGLAALCVLAVSVVLSDPRSSVEPDFAQQVTDETLSTLLKYLGVLTLVFWGVGIWRRRSRARSWSPSSLPPVPDVESVNRPLMALALLLWSAGLCVLISGPANVFSALSGGTAPAALLEAFAYDEGFAASRATVLWVALAASIAIAAWPVVTGRRAPAWRRVEAAASILLSLLIYASILAGDVFAQEPANEYMKLAMAIFAGWGLIEGVSEWARFGQPARHRTA